MRYILTQRERERLRRGGGGYGGGPGGSSMHCVGGAPTPLAAPNNHCVLRGVWKVCHARKQRRSRVRTVVATMVAVAADRSGQAVSDRQFKL